MTEATESPITLSKSVIVLKAKTLGYHTQTTAKIPQFKYLA